MLHKISTRELLMAIFLQSVYMRILSLYQFFFTFVFRPTNLTTSSRGCSSSLTLSLHAVPRIENIVHEARKEKKLWCCSLVSFSPHSLYLSLNHPLRSHFWSIYTYCESTVITLRYFSFSQNERVESFSFLHPNVTFLNCVSLPLAFLLFTPHTSKEEAIVLSKLTHSQRKKNERESMWKFTLDGWRWKVNIFCIHITHPFIRREFASYASTRWTLIKNYSTF